MGKYCKFTDFPIFEPSANKLNFSVRRSCSCEFNMISRHANFTTPFEISNRNEENMVFIIELP